MVRSDGRRRWIWWLTLALGVVFLAGAAFALSTWNNVSRVDINRPPMAASPQPESDGEDESPHPDDTAVPEFRLPPVPSAEDGIDTVLMIGTDSRLGLEEGFGEFEGERADVVLLLIRPRNGEGSAILSLPRDLWVSTPCGKERINETLEGCEGMNGETTLLVTVESLTGLGLDHLAMVDMSGFQEVVDDVGGYRICLERPVRDDKAHLEMDAGCHMADGEDTLAWLRSRETEELNQEGEWVRMSGVSDLTRNERQREFLVFMLQRLSDFTEPQDVLRLAQTIAPHLTVDSDLRLTQAVSLAWTMRGLGRSIEDITIPVEDYTTQDGAQVLVASVDIESVIADVIAVETVGEAEGGLTG